MPSLIIDLFSGVRDMLRQYKEYELADDIREFLKLYGVKIFDYNWGSIWIKN